MAPTPIPSPVVAFTAGIVHFQERVEHYLDQSLQWLGAMNEPNHTWRRLAAQYRWTGSTDTADDEFVTFDWVNITGGAVDGTWTTSDYTTMETKLDTFFGSLASQQCSSLKLIAYKWYVRSYNPYSTSLPFAAHGPPERVTVRSIAGAGSAQGMPSQVAISVTEKTPFPRNWGRFYVPGIGLGAMASSGLPRIDSLVCDAYATATQTLITSAASSQFQLVVPITSLGTGSRGSSSAGTPNRRLAQVTQVQVDNVPDVIRRRRPHLTTYKKVLP